MSVVVGSIPILLQIDNSQQVQRVGQVISIDLNDYNEYSNQRLEQKHKDDSDCLFVMVIIVISQANFLRTV